MMRRFFKRSRRAPQIKENGETPEDFLVGEIRRQADVDAMVDELGVRPALTTVTARAGTWVDSERAVVSREQLEQLRPALMGALVFSHRVELPGFPDWSFIAQQPASGVLTSVLAAPDDRKAVVFFVGADDDEDTITTWNAAASAIPTRERPKPPWLFFEVLDALGDWNVPPEKLEQVARGLAWAWLNPYWHVETWVPSSEGDGDSRIRQAVRVVAKLRLGYHRSQT